MAGKTRRTKNGSQHGWMRAFLLFILSVIIVAGVIYFTGVTPEQIDSAISGVFGEGLFEASGSGEQEHAGADGSPDDYSGLLPEKGKLTVTVLDVGQADCIVIVSPSGKTMLIDCGLSSTEDRVNAYLEAAQIDSFDVVVATHPHSDHIGGMAEILRGREFRAIYMPRVTHDSKTYDELISVIEDHGLKAKAAEYGVTIPFDDALTVQILAPVADDYDSLNDYSAVVRIDYNNSSFLFTGDAEMISEMDMVSTCKDLLNADVLKVGHHGSATSSTEDFLNAVSPQYAVISVGEGNSYGHPNSAVIDALEQQNCRVYRTDQDGTVSFVTDGKNYVVKTQR